MQPKRLAALQPTALSFSRSLMRKMLRERWQIAPRHFDIDERGRGEAIYRVDTGAGIFEFPVFSYEPVEGDRDSRIIGRNWDMKGALIEGEVSPEQVAQTREELPKLYAGRAVEGTLVWCRSNRSLRVFNHIVERLASGQQPDIPTIAEVCYAMRNTGLDGNGTFGTKSYLAYAEDHPLRTPYHAQMLASFLMREFAADLVEHLARARSSKSVPLAPEIRRFLGLGNGSGLGLVLWVVNHPRWVNRWLELRERALVSAKSATVTPDAPEVARLLTLLDRAIVFRSEDRTDYDVFTPSAAIAEDLRRVRPLVVEFQEQGTIAGQPTSQPWAALCAALPKDLDLEAEETVYSLLIELYPEVADELEPLHRVSEVTELQPEMTLKELRGILEEEYAWAFQIDMNAPGARRYTWYKSEEAEEPRRGPVDEVEDSYELGVDIPGEVQGLHAELTQLDPAITVGHFLLTHPERRFIVERVQSMRGLPYHAPYMNMFDDDFSPAEIIHLVNVGFFGLDKTKDYLQRVLRGLIYHGAPTAADIAEGFSGEWIYPKEPEI